MNTIINLDIAAEKSKSYPIIIGNELLGDSSQWQHYVAQRQLCIVSNELIFEHYGATLINALQNGVKNNNSQQKQCITVLLPEGESHKNLAAITTISDALMQARFHRDAAIIALGGGIVGDIAAFAASIYQRGIAYVQIPTTLLAQVDSSVGGKTAVNHPLGKNMLGTFYQPRAVLIDTDTLHTLPTREYAAGMAEVIKYALINDGEFFAWLAQNMDAINAKNAALLQEMITRCCQHKANIVAADEREAGNRALLNLGHTFGHALEAVTNYQQFKHGEAVAIGIRCACELSRLLGNLTADEVNNIIKLLKKAQLPTKIDDNISESAIFNAMQYDKKVTGGKLRLVILKSFAHSIVVESPEEEIIMQAIRLSKIEQSCH